MTVRREETRRSGPLLREVAGLLLLRGEPAGNLDSGIRCLDAALDVADIRVGVALHNVLPTLGERLADSGQGRAAVLLRNSLLHRLLDLRLVLRLRRGLGLLLGGLSSGRHDLPPADWDSGSAVVT